MKLKIGTRGSPLAIAQTTLFKGYLKRDSEIITILTSGDKKQNATNDVLRDKKDWIIELEQNLISNNIDIAVHSSKDVPVDISEETILIPVLKRELPYDVLVSLRELDLNSNLRIGTSSLRRRAQLKLNYPHLNIEMLRGNINTRISKLDNGLDGIILAEAGLSRLGVQNLLIRRLDTEQFIPASNQGILAVQVRKNDNQLINELSELIDTNTKIAFETERALVQHLGADCHSAVGIFCKVENNLAILSSTIYSSIDSKFINCQICSDIAEYTSLATQAAKELMSKGAKNYL